MILKKKIFFKPFLFFFLFPIYLLAQISQETYKERLNTDYTYGYKGIVKMAEGNNAYDYMAIGYFINANNTMYLKTKNKNYLDYNLQVLTPMFLYSSKSSMSQERLMSVSSKNQNAWINGKESLVFEGYFYRYLGEFLYIIKQENLYKESQDRLLLGLENGFDKWYNKSVEKYGDASMLFHQRLHISATWANACLYLYEFTKNEKYKSFYTTFDKQLKNNLQTKKINGKEYYVWNSTYKEAFVKALTKKHLTPIVQDIGHGNHVVEYILTSYKLNKEAYKKSDLVKLANTIAYVVWQPKTKSFTDNVDGSSSDDSNLKKSGFKQTDGWMKLIDYNKELLPIYQNYLEQNKRKTENSVWGLQYLANIYYN